jgi:hypothetical protein
VTRDDLMQALSIRGLLANARETRNTSDREEEEKKKRTRS